MLSLIEVAAMRSKKFITFYKNSYNRLQKFDLAYKDYEASLLIDKILENIDQMQ